MRYLTGAAAINSEVDANFWLRVDAERLLREHYGIRYTKDGNDLLHSCSLTNSLHKRGDRNPSMRLNVKKNVALCWGCGRSGGLKWFIQNMEVDEHGAAREVSDEEAVAIAKPFERHMSDEEFAALIAELAEDRHGDMALSDEFVSSNYEYAVNAWAKNYHPYWAERGITKETVEMLGLGYDPESKRIVIPVKFKHQVVGFTKRTIADEKPKWCHNENLPRGAIVYNYDMASKYDSVVVVEAPLSAVWLWQCGIPNVVSTFGAKVSEGQLLLLRQWKDVIVFFDPDNAGNHGTEQIVKGLLGHSDTYVVNNAEGDPAEHTREEVWDIVYSRGLTPGYLWREQ